MTQASSMGDGDAGSRRAAPRTEAPRSIARIRARQLWVLTVKELRQVVRDRTLLIFVVYVFSLHVVISTLGAADDLRHLPTTLHDGDHSAESRELVQRLREPHFTSTGEVVDPRDGMRALDRGTVRMLVDVPDDFTRRLRRGDESVSVQLFIDTSKVSLGYLASSYASRITEAYGGERAASQLSRYGAGTPPQIENRQRAWFNFTLDPSWSMALFTLLNMMSVVCVMLPATAAVREKEHGTIDQLLVSPLTPLQIMTAKVAAMILVTIAGTVLAFYGVMSPIFGVPMRGSLVLFFAVVALYAFSMSGLGLVLATLARNSGQVGLLVILTVLPILNLSGTSSSIESMPRAMRWVVELSPLRHLVDIVYGLLFRGEGLATLWPSVLAMVAIGGVLFAIALSRFRKQFA